MGLDEVGTACTLREHRKITDALVSKHGAWHNRGLTPDHLARARRFFDRAMALDPGNLEAMVGLAVVDVSTVGILATNEWSTRFPAAEMLLTKVLSLAPNHAIAHACLGLLHMYTKRAAQGIADCENALALDRNFAGAHGLIGYAKYLIGRSAETEAHVNEALRLSPRDYLAHRWFLWIALAKVQLNLDNEAIIWLRRSLDANRNHSVAHFHVASTPRLGELEQARAALQEGLPLDPGFTIRRYRDATNSWSDNPAFLAGRERAIKGMRLAGVPEG